MGGDKTAGFTLRTSIASVVGGTASKLSGGKFSNGAVSGAFVHMFNAEGGTFSRIWKGLTGGISKVYDRHDEIISDAGKGFEGLKENAPRAILNAHPAAQVVLGGAALIVVAPVLIPASEYAMSNPETLMVVTDVISEGTLPSTLLGGFWWMSQNTDKLP